MWNVRILMRIKHTRVGRFVPEKGTPSVTFLLIHPLQHPPVRKHAIVMRKIVGGHLFRRGDHSVMRVVEEQPVVIVGRAMLANAAHQVGRIPFVHDDHVSACE